MMNKANPSSSTSSSHDTPSPSERDLAPSQPLQYLHKLCLRQQAMIRSLQAKLRHGLNIDKLLVTKFLLLRNQHESLKSRIRSQSNLLTTTASSLMKMASPAPGQQYFWGGIPVPPPAPAPAPTTPPVDLVVQEIRRAMALYPGDFAKVDWALMEELLGPDPNGDDDGAQFPVPVVIDLTNSSDEEGEMGVEGVNPAPASAQPQGGGRGRGRGGRGRGRGRKPPAKKAKAGRGK